jgi:hypothetical protein
MFSYYNARLAKTFPGMLLGSVVDCRIPLEGEAVSRAHGPLLMAVVILVGVPASALAQASVAGTVKDSSGAVLPGVTVEASSPALIEKARLGVTDGPGQ